MSPESGLRFGNSPESRLEFRVSQDLAQSLMEHSTVSLEFRTRHEDGILFYITNANKVDFIAIFMKQGRVSATSPPPPSQPPQSTAGAHC